MKTLLLLLLIPFWVIADDTKPTSKEPTTKESKRISVIEKDFRVAFVEEIQAFSNDGPTPYWTFVKMLNGITYKGFPFSVPVNATDKQIMAAIVSSMQTVQFYEMMIKKSPAPNPNLLYN